PKCVFVEVEGSFFLPASHIPPAGRAGIAGTQGVNAVRSKSDAPDRLLATRSEVTDLLARLQFPEPNSGVLAGGERFGATRREVNAVSRSGVSGAIIPAVLADHLPSLGAVLQVPETHRVVLARRERALPVPGDRDARDLLRMSLEYVDRFAGDCI